MPARCAELLLVDNSNSYTKFALSSETRLGSVRRLPTGDVSPANVRALLRNWEYQRVVLCSVVPAKAALLARIFQDKPVLVVRSKIELGIGIEYPKPATIGADRLANAAAAAAFYGAPSIVVDFGTAVSFDILAGNGNYVGGVIAPGLEAMTDYLHQRTALLPKISLLEPPGAIGKSTRTAMLSGAVHGYRGLIRQILLELRRELGSPKNLPVIATGGYAELIAAALPEIHVVRQDLTLQGLRILACLNPSPRATVKSSPKHQESRKASPLKKVRRPVSGRE
jgi:type III pantothenate kinase